MTATLKVSMLHRQSKYSPKQTFNPSPQGAEAGGSL